MGDVREMLSRDDIPGTSELLSALRKKYRPSTRTQHAPTLLRSPHNESMLEAVEETLAGRLPASEGLRAIHQQRQRLSTARAELEAMALPPDAPDGELVGHVVQLYVETDSQITQLEAAVTAGDVSTARTTAERLRDVTNRMYQCHEAWEAALGRVERVDGGMATVPEPYARLYDACDAVARGNASLEDWEKSLNAVEAEVRSTRHSLEEGLDALSSQLARDRWVESLAEQVKSGLDESLSALARMRRYREEGDVNHLNEGWNALVAGTLRIQKTLHALSAGPARGDVVMLEADE